MIVTSASSCWPQECSPDGDDTGAGTLATLEKASDLMKVHQDEKIDSMAEEVGPLVAN
jgi:hypothetical protein